MELSKSNSPPKLPNASHYYDWINEFESFCRFNDVQMWRRTQTEYVHPAATVEGETRKVTLGNMTGEERKEYDAEKNAWASLKMSLPRELLYLAREHKSANALWKAIEQKCASSAKRRKAKEIQLKKQFEIFKEPACSDKDDFTKEKVQPQTCSCVHDVHVKDLQIKDLLAKMATLETENTKLAKENERLIKSLDTLMAEHKESSVDSTCESSSREDQIESTASTESSVSETRTSTLAENSKPKQAMDNLKCFRCREHGHVASVCPNKKKVRHSQKTKHVARSSSPVRQPVKQRWVIKQERSSVSSDRPFKPSFRSSNPYCSSQGFNSVKRKSRSFSPPTRQNWIGKENRLSVSNDRLFRPSFRSMNHYCPRQRVNSFSRQSRSFSSTGSYDFSKIDGFLKEFVYENEKGQRRRVMAWVPIHN